MSTAKRKAIDIDPYQVLGLKLDATKKQIDKAYKKMALKWHPDKHTDKKKEAEIKFLEIYKAYEFLKDDEKKAVYDRDMEAKRKRAVYDNERKAKSSVQRQQFLDKLCQQETEFEARLQRRSNPQFSSGDTTLDEAALITKLRAEGAQLLKQLHEETQAQNLAQKKEIVKQNISSTTTSSDHADAHKYKMTADELSALEDEVLGL